MWFLCYGVLVLVGIEMGIKDLSITFYWVRVCRSSVGGSVGVKEGFYGRDGEDLVDCGFFFCGDCWF